MMCPRYGCTREMSSVKHPHGGVTGPNGVTGAGVVAHMGIGRSECVVVIGPVLFPVKGGVGKNSVCAGVMR